MKCRIQPSALSFWQPGILTCSLTDTPGALLIEGSQGACSAIAALSTQQQLAHFKSHVQQLLGSKPLTLLVTLHFSTSEAIRMQVCVKTWSGSCRA